MRGFLVAEIAIGILFAAKGKNLYHRKVTGMPSTAANR